MGRPGPASRAMGASRSFPMPLPEDGRRPSPEQARERLDHLDRAGNTDRAFHWAHLPHVKLWQIRHCA